MFFHRNHKLRFRGDGETQTSKILSALHSSTKDNNWIGGDEIGPDSLETIHTLCEIYGGEEQKLKTELRICHASVPNTSTIKGMLKTQRQQWTGYFSNTGENDKNVCNNSSVKCNSGKVFPQAQAGERHTQNTYAQKRVFLISSSWLLRKTFL